MREHRPSDLIPEVTAPAPRKGGFLLAGGANGGCGVRRHHMGGNVCRTCVRVPLQEGVWSEPLNPPNWVAAGLLGGVGRDLLP
jgi:hypothetical protein